MNAIDTSCNAKVNTNLGLGAALMGGGVVGTPDLPRKPSFMVVSRVERTRRRVHQVTRVLVLLIRTGR